MEKECVAKKWGSSIGIVIPKEIVDKEKIKADDKLVVEIEKKADFSDVFGSLKTRMTGRQFKDMVRKGWER